VREEKIGATGENVQIDGGKRRKGEEKKTAVRTSTCESGTDFQYCDPRVNGTGRGWGRGLSIKNVMKSSEKKGNGMSLCINLT